MHNSAITVTLVIYRRHCYINDLTKFQLYANLIVTVTLTKTKLNLTNPKLIPNPNLNPTLLTKDPLTEYQYYGTPTCSHHWGSHHVASEFSAS